VLSVGSETGLYVCSQPVDMRKAIDGLAILVIELLEKTPEADAAYVFYNKSRDKIKILCWHKNGFILFYKRLERGKFKFPRQNDTALSINKKQLSWLIAGLDFSLMDEFKALEHQEYY